MERKANVKRKIEEVSKAEEEKERDSKNESIRNVKRKKRNESNENVEEEKGSDSNNKMQRLILWFRNDIRLHDNPVLHQALHHPSPRKEIIPVYCFDPRFFTKRVDKYDMRKCGLIRTRFLLESVLNFRARLEKVGSRLLVTTA